MIAALSLMRRRADIGILQFRRHWLDPHGVMTAELPGLRRYVQSHCIEHPVTNELARTLDVAGFAELWFDDIEARSRAYASPRLAECNVDSEQFIGAVTRLVTEPHLVLAPKDTRRTAKAFLVATGAPDAAWSDATRQRITRLPGLVGYLGHRIIEQAAASNSRVPELVLPVAGIVEVTFASDEALEAVAGELAGEGAAAGGVAIYAVDDHVLT
jgi:uncharacterized protein (TIGR02118 family)